MLKKCSKCKDEKELQMFNKNKRKHDGYSTECKKCVNDYNEQYRNLPENKEVAKLYNKIYCIEKAKEIAANKKQYVLDNQEKVQSYKKNHYEQNKETYKSRTSKYKKDNPQKYKEYAHRRRAAKKSVPVELFTIQDIFTMYGSLCFYCGDVYEHLDHYIPLSKGGSHTLSNVRPSCKGCNLSKSSKLPEKWLEEKKNE